MSWLDIAIIVILIIPTFMGLKAGIIKTVLSFAGVVIGVLLAGRYYAALAENLTFISQPNLANIAAFAIILIGVMIVAGIASTVLTKLISIVLLGWVNRLGGAILGLLLGGTFCGALLAIWVKFLGISDPIADSALAILLLEYFPLILAILPEEFGTIRSFFQ